MMCTVRSRRTFSLGTPLCGAVALCCTLLAGALGAPPAAPTLHSEPKYAWPRQGELQLDRGWQLACTDPTEKAALPDNFDKLDWFATDVPTGVHWALYRAGRTPHPYIGLNIKEQRWIENKSWWFRTRFRVPDTFRGKQIRLIGDGVDYYAHYWLNGQYLGRSEGAFGTVKFTVGNLRLKGENELVVRVDCGGYKLKNGVGAPKASLVKAELWSGWSVGAADLNTVGIWQPLRLLANDWPTLERPFVRTIALSKDKARVRATVEVCDLADAVQPCEVVVALRGDGFQTPDLIGVAKVKPLEPMVLAEVDIEVPNPRLWWPNGLGAQPTYRAEFVLQRDGKTLDRLVAPFGIRTIERLAGAVQRTNYESRDWVFHVNGKPIFVKGVNWMPIDALADVRREQYEWCLRLARDAGVQMIRIWGGGIIETDDFYELCDRYGIMVWQDFPLTCGWRAADINRKLFRNAIEWTVFRLRNHPSLAFWCGGNEFPPDDRANTDLIGIMARATRVLDGTRPFMAASPDEGDIHAYPQWDASWAWKSDLTRGPFISEWGSHGMPTAQTYREMVGVKEAQAVIGPVLLKQDKKLLEQAFPEIAQHWIEFEPSRLPQMLARGSAYDDLKTIPLDRFTEAVAVGSGEFYKYSAEAARSAYPQNAGLLFWVWKRPWPAVAIQVLDGLGQPLAVYYDIKRAYSSPWPSLMLPQLNYVPGEEVTVPTRVLTEVHQTDLKQARLKVRLLGPDFGVRQWWDDLPPFDVPAGPKAVVGPKFEFSVPSDSGSAFFFLIAELFDASGKQLARNVYTLRCPPELRDAATRARYRAKPERALTLENGPWLRPQVEKQPTQLEFAVLKSHRESPTLATAEVEVANVGQRPAVMTRVAVAGALRIVADDGYFWLEPGQRRRLQVCLRLPGSEVKNAALRAEAWNATTPEVRVALER